VAAVAPPTPPADPWPLAAPRRRPRRRTLLVVGAILLVVAVAATIAIIDRGPSATARGRQLSARLVRAADLPPGWTVVPPTRPLAGSNVGCLGQLNVPADTPANFTIAAVGLRSRTGTPYLVEEVGTFPPAEASAQWDTLLSQAFHGCPSSAGAAADRRRPGVSPLRLSLLVGPPLGDQSVRFTVPAGGDTVVDLLMAKSGRSIMVLQVADHQRVGDALFARAASAAMRRLAG
jgi:hypothetical protein